jgi:hypothetical protein
MLGFRIGSSCPIAPIFRPTASGYFLEGPYRHGRNAMKRGLVVAGIVFALAGCAPAPIRWASGADYAIAISDNPTQQRFDLLLTSRASQAICLSNESWPHETGLPPGFLGARLKTSGGQRELLPTGSAYCPGGCGELRVEPGKQIRGVIRYEAFGDPTAIATDRIRALSFAPRPYVCPR